MINLKAPPGLRIELTEKYVAKVEDEIRRIVPAEELGMIVSNVGVTPGFSSMYTSNSGQNTAFIQVSLKEDHKVGSYEYMDRVRRRLAERSAGIQHLLSIRRPGGCGTQFRLARAH